MRHLAAVLCCVIVSALGAADIALVWNANAEPDVASYRVYRSSSPGVATSVGNRIATDVASPSYLDLGRPAGRWHYVVTAVDSAGNESLASAEVHADVAAPPPSAPHDAFATIQAEAFDQAQGVGIYSGGTGEKIGGIADGEWVRFDQVDFGAGALSIALSAASKTAGGTIALRLGARDGTQIGTVTVPGTGGWNDFVELEAAISGASGVHTLYLVFTGGSGALLDADWLRFSRSGITDPPPPPPPASPTRTITLSIDVAGWDWLIDPADAAGAAGAGHAIIFRALDPAVDYALSPVSAGSKPNG